ncbi:hypothetical protein L7F22_015727 [Adiantum nelumboides]|nr:hypothetical protein [Adiantum nelumboides]
MHGVGCSGGATGCDDVQNHRITCQDVGSLNNADDDILDDLQIRPASHLMSSLATCCFKVHYLSYNPLINEDLDAQVDGSLAQQNGFSSPPCHESNATVLIKAKYVHPEGELSQESVDTVGVVTEEKVVHTKYGTRIALTSGILMRTRLPDHPEFLTLQSKVESLQAQLQTEREMTDESMTQLMQKVTELEREKGKALLDAKHAREKIRALEEVLHDDHVWKDVNYDVDESIRLEDPENFELPFELYCDIMDEERTSHLERIAIMDDCVKSTREGIDKYKQIVLGNQVRSKSKQLQENLVDMLKFNSDYNRISKMTKQTTKWAVDGSSFSSTLDTGLELDVRGTSKRGCQSRCGHCSAGRHTIKMCPSREKMVVKSIKAKKHLSSTPQWSTKLKQVRQNYFQQEKFDNGSLGFNGIVRSQRRGEVHPIQEKVLDIYMVEIADWGDPDMSTAIVPYCHLSPVNSVNVKEEEKQEAEHLINKHSLLENVVYKEEKHPVIRAKSRSQSSFVVMKENLTVQWEVSEGHNLENAIVDDVGLEEFVLQNVGVDDVDHEDVACDENVNIENHARKQHAIYLEGDYLK